jgi:hypothetical protein
MDQGDNMAGDGGSSKPGNGKRSRRAAPPTIDLTATPVPDRAAAPEGAATADDAPPTAPAAMESAEAVAPSAQAGPDLANPPPEMPKSDDRNSDRPPPGGSDAAGPPRRAAFARPWPMIAAVAAAVAITMAVALIVVGLTTGAPPSDPALANRLAAIEAQVAALAGRPQPATADPKEIAALGARLAAIESQIGDLARRPAPTGTDPSKVAALDGRLDDVAKRLAVVEQVGQRLDEITARIAKIETALARPREADPAMLDRVAAVDTAVKSLLGRMNDLDKRLDALAATEREAAAHPPVAAAPDQAIRLAFLATMLRSAVERGAPFAAELAALKTIASDKASLASLDAFAASGVPSTNALSHELSALVPALLAAANPPQGDGSLMDRLGMTTRQLIRVRRVGDTPGDDPVSVIARIEVKAAHDDIAGALAEFAKLPEGVRAPAAAWIKKATQRITAIAATQKLTADALDGLAKPAPKPAP